MFLIWLLWLTIVFGGFYLGIGYGLHIYRTGFEISSLLNTLVYCSCAIFCTPKLLKLFVKK
jgi:hypothetical protein